MKPLAVDLFSGLDGWGEAFVSGGYRVLSVDIVDMRKELGLPPLEGHELLLEDIHTFDGRRCKDAAVIVASPPCQKYSYMGMPWKKAKALAEWYRGSPERIAGLNALFNACFRIQREASEAAGRRIPLIVENVKGAQPWVGRAQWHFGSFYLWGDVPALMPIPRSRAHKSPGESWSASRPSHTSDHSWKVPGQDWSRFAKTGEVSPHWRMEATKVPSDHGRRTDVGNGVRFSSWDCGIEGIKQNGSGRGWFAGEGEISRVTGSHSEARKAASAQIAKIPFPLARHIARCFLPTS